MYEQRRFGEKQNLVVVLHSVIKFIRDFEKYCAQNNIQFTDKHTFANKIGGIFKVINYIDQNHKKISQSSGSNFNQARR